MYNEHYLNPTIDNINDKLKVVGYEDKYKTGYRYYYDNNKILIDSPTSLSIFSYPCLKVSSNFIWHQHSDFPYKILINGFNYVIPQLGDYLIINQMTGKYSGLMDKAYSSPYTQQYDITHKVEKYTGGMLDGYLYFVEAQIEVNQLDPNKLIRRTLNNDINDYLFDHKLDIYEIPYIQDQPKNINGVVVDSKKIRVGYDDLLLFTRNCTDVNCPEWSTSEQACRQNYCIFGFNKVLPKNAIAYETNTYIEINIEITSDLQTSISWIGNPCLLGTSIIDVYVNSEYMPRDKYSVLLYKKNSLGNYILIQPQDVQIYHMDVYINDILQPSETYNELKTVIIFTGTSSLMKKDIVSIRHKSQTAINQYNKYNLSKD